jgi:hypothetical protein
LVFYESPEHVSKLLSFNQLAHSYICDVINSRYRCVCEIDGNQTAAKYVKVGRRDIENGCFLSGIGHRQLLHYLKYKNAFSRSWHTLSREAIPKKGAVFKRIASTFQTMKFFFVEYLWLFPTSELINKN